MKQFTFLVTNNLEVRVSICENILNELSKFHASIEYRLEQNIS